MDEPVSEKRLSAADWAAKEVDFLFSRFTRYTRFVLFSKWFLIVFAVGLMVALIAVPLISKDRSGVRVSFVDSRISGKGNAKAPVMNNPEYRGTSEKGDQFKVGGLRAIQQTPTLIKIEKVEAQLVTPSGSWRSLTAESAEYEQEAKMITLLGDVTLLDEQGYSFVTDRATINTETMEVVGNSPIQGVGPMGNLLASTFKIEDSGKRIIFMGEAGKQLRLRIDRKAKQ